MNRIILYIFLVLILVGVGLFEYKSKPHMYPPKITEDSAQTAIISREPPEAVDFTATFSVYTNGLKRDFSQAMYHNLSPDAYIASSESSLVHVKKRGVTWGNFFDTLPFKITSRCLTTGTGETFCDGQGGTLAFYLNGIKQEDLLMQPIGNEDILVIKFDRNP